MSIQWVKYIRSYAKGYWGEPGITPPITDQLYTGRSLPELRYRSG